VSKLSSSLPATIAADLAAEVRAPGRQGGVEGPRRNAAILATLGMLGLDHKAAITAKSAGLALAVLAHGGLHLWIVSADGKPGKAPRLTRVPKAEGVTFAACKVPALGRCPAGLEIVDHAGNVWRAKDGKPCKVAALKASPALSAALAAQSDDAGKASAWLAYHLASPAMLGGLVAGLPKSKPSAEAGPLAPTPEPEAQEPAIIPAPEPKPE
jgi:hypothetical protein